MAKSGEKRRIGCLRFMALIRDAVTAHHAAPRMKRLEQVQVTYTM
ncbi:hypothetical protein [Nitrosomonas oligotropha]|nr:hypothetical protein [Nitrosomonas oligotropha]